MLVEDLTTTGVVTVEIQQTARTAVETMPRNHTGSAIVVDGDNPTGIVTETDVLRVGYATDECSSEIPPGIAKTPCARRDRDCCDSRPFWQPVGPFGAKYAGAVGSNYAQLLPIE